MARRAFGSSDTPLPERPRTARDDWNETWSRAELLTDVQKYRWEAADKGSYTAVATLTRQESELLAAREADHAAWKAAQPVKRKAPADIAARIPELVADMSPALFQALCRCVDARRGLAPAQDEAQ